MEIDGGNGLWTRGRCYGLVGSIVLLGFLVVPTISQLADCSTAPCSGRIATDALVFVAMISASCIGAGWLISLPIDKEPRMNRTSAAATFAALLAFFGSVLWLFILAATW